MSHVLPAHRPENDSFWGWPDFATLRTFIWVGTAGAIWFALIYGGADYVTSRRTFRVAVHFEAEKRLPALPATVWAYMSIYALFLMGPFVLRSSRRLIALGAALAVVALVAGLGFLLFPSELVYPTAVDASGPGATAALYRFADWLNLEHNLLPSLHVALCVTCIAAYAPRAGRVGQLLLWIWAIAVALSTIFTHFHHVLDAVTGFALGLVGTLGVYEPLADRRIGEMENTHRRKGAAEKD
jgi:membrane-associated phospholipid phosphatase